MHYKNKRPAKVGDFIIARDFAGTPFAGIVAIINEQSAGSGCALQMLPFGGTGMFLFFDSLACVHLDDLDARPYDESSDPDGATNLELKAGNNAAALVAAHVVAMGAAGATIPVKLADGSLFTVTVSPGAAPLNLAPDGLYGSVKETDNGARPGEGTQAGTGTDGNGQPLQPVEDTKWEDQPRFGGEGKVDALESNASGVGPDTDANAAPASIKVPDNPEKVN